MSKTERPVNTPAFKEIIINSGSTAEIARKATSILQVPNLEKTIDPLPASLDRDSRES